MDVGKTGGHKRLLLVVTASRGVVRARCPAFERPIVVCTRVRRTRRAVWRLSSGRNSQKQKQKRQSKLLGRDEKKGNVTRPRFPADIAHQLPGGRRDDRTSVVHTPCPRACTGHFGDGPFAVTLHEPNTFFVRKID